MDKISPNEASQMVTEGALLLDVRTPGEFSSLHASGADLVPLNKIQSGEKPTTQSDEQPIVVLCKSGKRAEMAAIDLSQSLANPVHVVEGGTDGWVAAGLPHERGEGVISLERQVRIGAGSLVLVGVALSFLLAPQFVFLSAFVGAGLVFAGITDTCGMGMLLAKMPWNQRAESQGFR